MTQPKRLFESGSPLERTILGYGRDEAPTGDLARKTLAAMAAAPAANAAPAPARSAWTRPRWIIGGVCALGLAAVALSVVRREEVSAPAVPIETAAPPAETAAPVENGALVEKRALPTPVPQPEVVVTPDSLPSAPARSAAPPGSTAVPRTADVREPAPASSASIAREIELLDIVKAKLGTGDAAAAARALDAYDAEFSQGTLRPEATVLRVRTLLARGDRAAAEKVGAAFLAKHPTGVHAKRVRTLLADPSGGGGSSEPSKKVTDQ